MEHDDQIDDEFPMLHDESIQQQWSKSDFHEFGFISFLLNLVQYLRNFPRLFRFHGHMKTIFYHIQLYTLFVLFLTCIVIGVYSLDKCRHEIVISTFMIIHGASGSAIIMIYIIIAIHK